MYERRESPSFQATQPFSFCDIDLVVAGTAQGVYPPPSLPSLPPPSSLLPSPPLSLLLPARLLLLLAIAIVVACTTVDGTIHDPFLFLPLGSGTLTIELKTTLPPSLTVRRTRDLIRSAIGLANSSTFYPRQQERRYTLAFLAAGYPRGTTPRPRDFDNATLVSGCH
ncbi:hypothetical protein ALC53_08958 [Atta colombica]|uniref:Uncharacterized protein n=1 Tax=Atta colombica TaxID=520822 RepID=A0A151I1V4_9HYME|nr:hypothetical protein ALC53_08958 [Atta colombica]